MHTDIQNGKYLITHVVLKDVAFFNILFVDLSSKFSSGGLEMQLINIHLADKGTLVIKFAKHWFLIVVIFQEHCIPVNYIRPQKVDFLFLRHRRIRF